MLKKQDFLEIFKVGGILCLITAVAALALAATNAKTAPLIAQHEQEKQEAAMKVVLPDADGFRMENLKNDSMEEIVTAVYAAKDQSGYAVMVSPNGYNGAVSLAVGVLADGTVSGIDVISQSETAGLGANCVKESFKDQFAGKTEGITVVKTGASGNQINAISSATITSKAVTSGVNAAISAVKEVKEHE